MFYKYISLSALLISFVIGVFLCYYWEPEITPIIVHPTPQNSGKIVYKDKLDTCYIYKTKEVSCPKDTTKIKEIPIEL